MSKNFERGQQQSRLARSTRKIFVYAHHEKRDWQLGDINPTGGG
jgi:hypothetical protein